MSIDWEFVGSLTDEQIKESDDDHFHQEICELLVGQIDDSALTDGSKVKRLLHIAGLVIQQKADDLQEIESYGTELVNKAESKIVKLENELQAKESIISDLQNGGTGRDARYMRDELRTLQGENEKMKRELKDHQSESTSAKENVAKMTNDYMECKAVNRRLESDNDQLKKDILDLKNQMDAQREALMIKRDGDEGRLMKRMQSKEQIKFMGEIHELSEANEFLKDEVEDLTEQLKVATSELVKLTDEYAAMKTVIDETDKANTRLEEDNVGLKLQVRDLQAVLLEQGSADNKVMSHVNAEVEKWKNLLDDTERQLVEERKKNHIFGQQLDATKLDTDKKVMAELAQAVSDKDKQIEDLKTELDEGYKQMKLMGEFADELQASEAVKETNHLEKLLNDYKNAAKSERERLRKLETDSAERDKQLAEALARIAQYENGTYGLREAVQEIKDLKKQLGIRDNEINGTTKQMNKLEMNLCQALDENEEMRRRLGLGPSENIDLSELKFTAAAEQEQARAVNRLLSNEVERLERERIELKKLLRKQAMHRGVRAVELGLKTEDLEAIEEAAADSTANLSANQSQMIQDAMLEKLQRTKSDEKSHNSQLQKELKELKMENNKLTKLTEDLSCKSSNVQAQLTKAENERARFEAALQEALQGKANAKPEDQPEIYRLLSLLEDKLNQAPHPGLSQHLKAQVAQLNGRNLELRSELSRAKDEVRRCERERANAVADLARFAPSAGGAQNLPALGGHEPLAKQLIIALQEVEEKDLQLREMERTLLNTQDQMSRLTAQQGMLYEEHYKLKSDVNKKELAKDNDNNRDSLQVYKEELQRLQRVNEQSPDKQKASISDSSRRLVLLKVHERTMRREIKLLYEREARNEREIARLKILDEYRVKDMRERVAWLEQFKDVATYHINQLREEVITCVPQKEVEKLYKSYTSITTKYRALLEEGSLVQTSAEELAKAQEELRHTHHQLEESKKQIVLKTKRCEGLEERLAALNEPTRDIEGESANLEDKLYNLEMQLLNEKQKASHAIKKHSKLLSVTQELENRNAALEEKFTELVDKNSALEEREKSLTDDLEKITKYGGKDSRAQMLEKQIVELQSEIKQVKMRAEISADQTRTLLCNKDKKDKEIEQYRLTLGQLDKQTDDRLTIGLLTERLIETQKRDLESNKLAEEFKVTLAQEQNKILVLENKLSDQLKVEDLHHVKAAAHVQLLARTVCYLRAQFSGTVPLQRQQRLSEAVRALVTEKQDLNKRVVQVEEDRIALEVELEHLKTSTSSKPTTTTLSKLRLSEMRLKREVSQLKQQQMYLEKLVKDHEETIRELEDENSGVYELLTELKDNNVLNTIQSVTSRYPDVKTQGRSVQDKDYVLCRRCRDKLGAKESTKQSKIVSLEVDYITKQLQKKEEKLVQQKEEITLLRSSLSAANNKLSQHNKEIDKLEEKLAGVNESNIIPEECSTFKKSQASAQQVITVLNDRLAQKEEVITKYQNMLRDLREEAKLHRDKHDRETDKLVKEHSYKESEWLGKYQDLAAELQSLQDLGSSHAVPHKRAELEELILEQDKGNAVLRDNIFKLRQEISDLKGERNVALQIHEKALEKLKKEYSAKAKKVHAETKDLKKQNDQILAENKDVLDQLKCQKNSKTPEKKKLLEKEDEIKKLKEALVLLRQEMSTLIEDKMRENVVSSSGGAVLKGEREVEGLRSKVAKLQKERDEAVREKFIIEAQLGEKSTPKQAAEIETLQKQLAIQKDKAAKLKVLHEAQRIADQDKNVVLSRPASTTRDVPVTTRDVPVTTRDVPVATRDVTGNQTVMGAWLENKKWSKKIENLKKDLEKKQEEIESLTKQNTGMRSTIDRLDREKVLLNTKLKNAQKTASKQPTKKDPADTKVTQELKKKIFDLEDECVGLKKDLGRDITNPLASRDSTIGILKQTISGLEEQLQESNADSETFHALREANISQEKKLIGLEHELLSLKLRAEHAELEIPRLRTRVNDLQAYTDVLKPQSVGAPHKVPTKSAVELERVINAMKRVIEKLQKENAQQKTQIDFLNRCDKEKVKVETNSAKEDTRLATEELQVAKEESALRAELDDRVAENAFLKKELTKLKESLQETRTCLEKQSQESVRKEESGKMIDDLERQLSQEKSVVTGLRDHVTKVEEDNNRKKNLLSEIRRRLTGVAEREADLEEEIRLLHECKMPNGAKEIAKEAVRIKRQNSRLSEQLQNLTPTSAPTLDPVFLEKLEDLKSDNEIMVRKMVFYQGQLKDLSERHPDENIILQFSD